MNLGLSEAKSYGPSEPRNGEKHLFNKFIWFEEPLHSVYANQVQRGSPGSTICIWLFLSGSVFGMWFVGSSVFKSPLRLYSSPPSSFPFSFLSFLSFFFFFFFLASSFLPKLMKSPLSSTGPGSWRIEMMAGEPGMMKASGGISPGFRGWGGQ